MSSGGQRPTQVLSHVPTKRSSPLRCELEQSEANQSIQASAIHMRKKEQSLIEAQMNTIDIPVIIDADHTGDRHLN